MKRTFWLCIALSAALGLGGCAADSPGEQNNGAGQDAGADASPGKDASGDTAGGADINGPEDDAQEEADADDEDVRADDTRSEDTTGGSGEPDAAPEPDPDPDPDPEPPTWGCGQVTCDEVELTTTLRDMKEVDSCGFELAFEKPLSEGEELAEELLERLESDGLGWRRSMSEVMDKYNRVGRRGLSSDTKERLAGLGAEGFRWNQQDIDAQGWYPQGITGSSDASEDGRVNGRKLMVTAWYHKTDARPTKGARIAIADLTDPERIDYRLLILVDPVRDSNGKADFHEAAYDGGNALHSGGIVWYGDYLYVADTTKGIRIYDLSRIFQPTDMSDKSKVGIEGGKSYAHGYRFAVPRIARYRLTRDSCPLRFSFIGLDRNSDPPAIINGEYYNEHHNGRMAVWPMDPTTHLMEEREGVVKPNFASVVGQTRLQGVIRAGGYYYFSASSQEALSRSDGRLYKTKLGRKNTSVNWVYGPEDLYLDRETGRVWTNAEWPGHRDVVGIPLP